MLNAPRLAVADSRLATVELSDQKESDTANS